MRPVEALVIARYAEYWHERTEAQQALRTGAVEPVQVAYRLQTHHLEQFAT